MRVEGSLFVCCVRRAFNFASRSIHLSSRAERVGDPARVARAQSRDLLLLLLATRATNRLASFKIEQKHVRFSANSCTKTSCQKHAIFRSPSPTSVQIRANFRSVSAFFASPALSLDGFAFPSPTAPPTANQKRTSKTLTPASCPHPPRSLARSQTPTSRGTPPRPQCRLRSQCDGAALAEYNPHPAPRPETEWSPAPRCSPEFPAPMLATGSASA